MGMHLMTHSVRAMAVLAAVIAAGVGRNAAAQSLYVNDSSVWGLSTNSEWALIKGSSWVVPTKDRLTLQFDASASGYYAYQNTIRVVIYDHTGNYIAYADWRAPMSRTNYYVVFAVKPRQPYVVKLFINDIQAFQPYSVFYNDFFQVMNGNVPFGIRIN
jgi:hypothetical protein